MVLEAQIKNNKKYMQILVQPSDLIIRCLWDTYKKFCLKHKTEDDITEIIDKNEITVISEEDAYVIGLIRIVQTDNLIHRFNIDIDDVLKVRSTIVDIDDDKKVVINKPTILREINSFKNKFPIQYKPNKDFKKGIEDLLVYIDKVYSEVDKLEVYDIMIKEKIQTFVLSNKVKKIIKKNSAI